MRRAAAVAAVALLVLVCTALAIAAATAVSLPSVLAAPIAKAKTSGVRVLIPATLDAGLPASRLYATGGATAHGYDIQLAAAPSCKNDSTACFVAEFWGGPGKLGTGAPVTLSKGLAGRYIPSRCGASCAPAQIDWIEFGSRYTIQFTASKSAMVALANSAIRAGPR